MGAGGWRFTGETKQPAEMVEAQVQERLPHLSLVDPAGYEGKGLPAWWHCALHDCRFRASASALVRPNAVGCPDCVEHNKRSKRRARFADPDLEQHLEIIRRQRDDTWALIYRLRCAGATCEEISTQVGIKDITVYSRLERIQRLLRNAKCR